MKVYRISEFQILKKVLKVSGNIGTTITGIGNQLTTNLSSTAEFLTFDESYKLNSKLRIVKHSIHKSPKRKNFQRKKPTQEWR